MDYKNLRLFIYIDLGTGEYWFYPSWCHFPPDYDYLTVNLSANSVLKYPIIKRSVIHYMNVYPTFGAFLTDSKMTKIIGNGDYDSYFHFGF